MSDNKWSAADIFKARILDAWEQADDICGLDFDLAIEISEVLTAHGLIHFEDGSLTDGSRTLVDRARKEGVL